tara:strand:+ start:136 stop:807 length:672 start_codon:yes stop_codon:yes gene_type:complete
MEKTMHEIKSYGSDWGGWRIVPSLIRDNSHIVSLGLAHDFSFDIEMLNLNKSVKIVGVDPTALSRHTYRDLVNKSVIQQERFTFLPLAIYGERNKIINLGGPAKTCFSSEGETARTITVDDILNKVGDVCLLKMDIEGSEYSVFEKMESLSVDQLCVEWHHWLNKEGDAHPHASVTNPYTLDDTKRMIEKIESFGYKMIDNKCDESKRVIQETLFVRKDLLDG